VTVRSPGGVPVHAIVELRRYLLHPGRRDELIELFDAELVEPQEADGMQVVGQFRDLDRPDAFVWLRAFPTMRARRAALEAFYGGAVWARHGMAAAATMVDSDDVLLLRPFPHDRGLLVPAAGRPAAAAGDGAPGPARGLVVAAICERPPGDAVDVASAVAGELVPTFEAAGARTIGVYETDPSENDFAPLPVRDADVVVWFGAVAGDPGATPLPSGAAWRAAAGRVRRTVGRAPEVLRLAPTPRSLLDGRGP
jgi:hypothetical protein